MERALDPRTESTVADLYLNDIVGASRQAQRHRQQRQRNTRPGRLYPRNNHRRPEALFPPPSLPTPPPSSSTRRTSSRAPTGLPGPTAPAPSASLSGKSANAIRLERNDLYYKEPAHLDAVNLLLSGGVGMTMYENNEIDFTGVGLADIDRVLDPTEEINRDLQITPPDYSVSYFGLNTQMAPFDDIKVRKALALAINKELIAEAVLSNLVVPAYGILPPGFPGHNQNLQGIRFDIEEAMRTLAESSYGRGDPAIAEQLMQADTALDDESRIAALSEASRLAAAKLPTIILSVPGGGGAVGLDTEVVLAIWHELLGVNVEVQQSEFATFLNDVDRRRYQMFTLGWVADYPDPQNFLDIPLPLRKRQQPHRLHKHRGRQAARTGPHREGCRDPHLPLPAGRAAHSQRCALDPPLVRRRPLHPHQAPRQRLRPLPPPHTQTQVYLHRA